MKNAVLAFLAVVGLFFCLAGCSQEVPYTGNTDDKVLVITNLTGTDVKVGTKFACRVLKGANDSGPKGFSNSPQKAGTTYVFHLHQGSNLIYAWRENGFHYININLTNDGEAQAEYWYVGQDGTDKKRVDFDQETITIPWSHFKKLP